MSVFPRESIERLVETEIGHRWGVGHIQIRLEKPAEVEAALLTAYPFATKVHMRRWRNVVRSALAARGVDSPMVVQSRTSVDADPLPALTIDPGELVIGRAP